MIKVAIVERTVLGLKGYRAECLGCDWKGPPREQEAKAVEDAKSHRHGKRVMKIERES